jgi:hypothetical protein
MTTESKGDAFADSLSDEIADVTTDILGELACPDGEDAHNRTRAILHSWIAQLADSNAIRGIGLEPMDRPAEEAAWRVMNDGHPNGSTRFGMQLDMFHAHSMSWAFSLLEAAQIKPLDDADDASIDALTELRGRITEALIAYEDEAADIRLDREYLP